MIDASSSITRGGTNRDLFQEYLRTTKQLLIAEPSNSRVWVSSIAADSFGSVREIVKVPLHLSTAGKRFAARPSNCPVSEDLSARLLRLPFYNDITAREQDRVITALGRYRHFQKMRAV